MNHKSQGDLAYVHVDMVPCTIDTGTMTFDVFTEEEEGIGKQAVVEAVELFEC